MSFSYNFFFDLVMSISNNTVFIVYGIETETKLAENVLILNVTDPLNINLLNKLDSPSTVSPPAATTEANANDSGKGLTSGATIGIGVGVSFAVNIPLH